MNEGKPLMQVWDYPDEFDVDEDRVLKVSNQNVPNEKISPEALYQDKQTLLKFHEKKFALILVFCSIYFLGVLL